MIPLIVLFLQASQDDPARNARELAEKLRSDRIEVREEASRKLEELGTKARPALEALLQDKDAEVRQRAREILDEIEWRERTGFVPPSSKRATVDVKNASLDIAGGMVLHPFSLKGQIENGGQDLGITSVTLKLQDASFWEALDGFTQSTGLSLGGDLPFPFKSEAKILTFRPVARRTFRWDTVGDIRIFAGSVVMGGGGVNHGDLTAKLSVVMPPWAVPKRLHVEEVSIAGQAISASSLILHSDSSALPRQDGCLTAVEVWKGKDAVKRTVLKGSESFEIQGTLVIAHPGRKGDREVRSRFKISEMPVPAVPPLPR